MILTLSLTVLVTSIPGFDILGNTELEKHLIHPQFSEFSEEKSYFCTKMVDFEEKLAFFSDSRLVLFRVVTGPVFDALDVSVKKIFVSITVYMF